MRFGRRRAQCPALTVLALVAAAAFMLGCQAVAPAADPVPADPDVAASALRNDWLIAPENAPYADGPGRDSPSRAMTRKRAENTAFRYPDHVPTRMLCAVLAYEMKDTVRAVQHLDHVLDLQPPTPEAAVLRAQISLEEGNYQHALRILSDNIRMRPDHAGLRETYASAQLMAGDPDGALASLHAAETLGAPAWRVAYNRGLIAEESGDYAEARAQYEASRAEAPGWAPPRNRLAGLGVIETVGAPAQPPSRAQFPPPNR